MVHSEEPARKPTTRRAVLLEALAVFGVATLLSAMLWQLRVVSGFISQNLQTFIAAIFLYLPTGLLLRRKEDFAAYGLTTRPRGKGLKIFLLGAIIVFPLFAVGFYGYYHLICRLAKTGTPLPRQLRVLCMHFVGQLRYARLRLPPAFGQLALAQLLVVALPEEYFFRGYLQTRLEAVWPSTRRFLGAPVGPSLLLASLLFGLGHVLVDLNGLRLAVFFPALVFGWMRQASGSILAPVLFHACSNLVSELLRSCLF